MVELTTEHIDGKKTYKEVKDNITSYNFKDKNISNREKEADEVSLAIYEILSDKAFRFDYLTYKN